MLKRKIRLIISILSVIMLGILPGCANQGETGGRTYNVGTWRTAQTIQPFFYSNYIPDGDTLNVFPFTNPGDQKSALLAGSLDLCGSTWPTAIMAASNGEPIKVVANLCNKCAAFVVSVDSGIQSIADLRGKRIAYVAGSIHYILLLETLKKADLDPQNDITLVSIDFFDMGLAMANGQIDAFLSGEPYPSVAVTEGYGRILEYPYYPETLGYINGVMITSEAKISADPEGIQNLINAHAKSSEYLMQNTSVWLLKAEEFGTDIHALEQSAENIELSWEITPQMIEQVKYLAQRMFDLGVITSIPDIDTMVDLQFIKNVNIG